MILYCKVEYKQHVYNYSKLISLFLCFHSSCLLASDSYSSQCMQTPSLAGPIYKYIVYTRGQKASLDTYRSHLCLHVVLLLWSVVHIMCTLKLSKHACTLKSTNHKMALMYIINLQFLVSRLHIMCLTLLHCRLSIKFSS